MRVFVKLTRETAAEKTDYWNAWLETQTQLLEPVFASFHRGLKVETGEFYVRLNMQRINEVEKRMWVKDFAIASELTIEEIRDLVYTGAFQLNIKGTASALTHESNKTHSAKPPEDLY